jgi:GH35 family endo-1,4-beta-xylanase
MSHLSAAAKLLSRNLFNPDEEIDERVRTGIEQNRKGRATLILKDADGNRIPKASVRCRLIRHEYAFGGNSFMVNQAEDDLNQRHDEAFTRLFNLAVVPFYWSDLEPEEGMLRFESDCQPIYRRPPIESILDFCQMHDITPKGHPLCWKCFLPDWLPHHVPAERLARRIAELAERYGSRIFNWDVINEALYFNDDANRLPPNAVELAFDLAEHYFSPSVTLNYNETPDNSWSDYRGDYTPLVMLIKLLQAKGKKVDGLGLQYHLFGAPVPVMQQYWPGHFLNQRHLMKMMDLYAGLGIPFNISEVTLTAHEELGPNAEEFQARLAAKLYPMWFSHPGSNGIIYWNLIDNTAYVNPQNPSWNENIYLGGLLRHDRTPKPVFEVIDNLINHDWHTDCHLDYVADHANHFRGFYGKYELEIDCNQGRFRQEINLCSQRDNTITLALKEKK